MSLSERSRTRIYQALEPLAGEEAVGEMLSYFPARDVEEPVTKELLRAELADVRTEMATLGSDLRIEMTTLGSDLRSEMATLAAELRSEIKAMGDAHHRDQRQLLTWLMSTILSAAALIIAAVAVVA